MRLFSMLFNIAKLPVAIVADAVCALPDASMGKEVGARTKEKCSDIDREISK